jgi:hypothetical protein
VFPHTCAPLAQPGSGMPQRALHASASRTCVRDDPLLFLVVGVGKAFRRAGAVGAADVGDVALRRLTQHAARCKNHAPMFCGSSCAPSATWLAVPLEDGAEFDGRERVQQLDADQGHLSGVVACSRAASRS